MEKVNIVEDDADLMPTMAMDDDVEFNEETYDGSTKRSKTDMRSLHMLGFPRAVSCHVANRVHPLML